MDGAILELASLSVRFGGLQAVNNISLTVRPREVFGLLGPNGAGKTTLFNMIAGVVTPTSGVVKYKSEEIGWRSVCWRARAGIARTFQITQPFGAITVLENVIVGAMLKESRMSVIRREAEELLDYVGLSAKRDHLADALSTGQRKRLELARALAIKPDLLLMDEVTGGVDQPSIPGLIDLVASLKERGVTIVLVEHNMKVMAKLCDRMLFMNRGEMMVEGTPDHVLNHPNVARLYLGEDEQC
ncbi:MULTISPECIES: ABC transporter ATP-binding protein [unclassified Xanthobacter]|uniref:ABC transporter ATP-binding protein n=1 Tax=unclassified Xanthobacter TaxID=2623496 RepID=UPI001EDDB88D|nr:MULTISPECIES: ABC transporter ATP-binding protein [unclassified Xanthobacter]